MIKIAIVDYGMGNIHSVNKALQLYGAQTLITSAPEAIASAQKCVLPGVGAFDDAMQELKKQNLIDCLREYVRLGKPLLGVCLGMQLFFEESEEGRSAKGLGFLKGKVKKFKPSNGKKVPHMGWNQIQKSKSDCPLLKDVADNSFVYFCHSYYPEPRETETVAATTPYGLDFASLVWKGHLYGVQFHPEKSQAVGLKMFENFVRQC
ncbi:MAG: imidazole glycerol phosphate synthase subunit HisH [Candidatus Omnitrophota bacterium]